MHTNEDLERIAEKRREWEETALAKMRPRDEEFTTISGIPLKDVYTPEDVSGVDYLTDLGFPGEYPFTRGAYPPMNRGRPWTVRQVVGVGTAQETNLRHKFVANQGQTGMSNDFDVPTCIGLDSDHPLALGEVGRVGVAIDSLADMEALYDGIPLEGANHSFTINHPTPAILSMFVALAEKQGVPLEKLVGTTQNDPLKECFAMKMFSFPPRSSVKLLGDTWEYAAQRLPRWNITNLCGYPTRDSGGTSWHELGLTFASAVEYFEEALKRGMKVDAIAPQISFLWYVHIDLLEEIAKFRAARRVWAKLLKERYGAKDPRSWRLRMHAQTGGGSYTFQQPENNIVRGTIGGLAAALGGVQSMAIACYDEALSIPSEKAHRLSIRTQQIIRHESGIAGVVDPFAGSYFMEWLTNEVEERTWKVMEDVAAKGGMAKCVETGYLDKMLTHEAYKSTQAIQNKQKIVVGVNEYVSEEEEEEPEIFRVTEETEKTQLANLKKLKAERSSQQVRKALDGLRTVAERGDNVMPSCVEAAKVYATEGEILGVLREVYGEFKPPSIF